MYKKRALQSAKKQIEYLRRNQTTAKQRKWILNNIAYSLREAS